MLSFGSHGRLLGTVAIGASLALVAGVSGPVVAAQAAGAPQGSSSLKVPIHAALPADPKSPVAQSVSGQPPANGTSESDGRRHFDQATSKVIGRDAKTNTFVNADGSRTLQSSVGSLNYETADGSWLPIDNSLTSDPDREGGVTNAANGWRVHFGTSAQGVSLDTEAGSIGIVAKGAADVVPEVSGSTVTYKDLWPGTDLKYVVTADAVKETIVIKSADAGASFGFTTVTGSKQEVLAGTAKAPTSMAADEGGGLVLPGALGNAVHIDAPIVVSADGDEKADRGIDPKLTYAGGVLNVSVAADWLAAQPPSAFPILLDPTLSTGASSWYGFRSDGVSQTNPSAGVQVGNSRAAGDTYWRGIASFPISSVGGAHIYDAEVFMSNIAGTTNAYPLNVYWPSAISYAGVPGTSGVGATGAPGAGAWVTGAGMVNWVQTLANTSYPNSVLGFIGTDTPGSYTYQGFSVSLWVDYDHDPTPAVQAGSIPADQATVATVTPTLSLATASTDPDAGDSVTYNFTISGSGQSSGRASSGWLTSPTWVVPAGVLQDGQTYTWSVATSDGRRVTAPTWSRTLTVNQRLGTSQVTPSDSLAGVSVNLANGNANVQVTGHSVNSVGGALGVGFTYNSQAVQANGLLGRYYPEKASGSTFTPTTSPALVRTDPNLNFSWPGGTVDKVPSGLPTSGTYMVKWTGYVTAPTTGSYQFGTTVDDGAHVLVNGTSVFAAGVGWPTGSTSLTWGATAVTLTAGVPTPIEVWYNNVIGPGQFSLYVQGPGISSQLVPSAWLTPGVSSLPAGWTMSLPGDDGGYSHAEVTPSSVIFTDVSGGTHTYLANGGGGYTPPGGEDGVVTVTTAGQLSGSPSPGTVTLTDSDGSIYTFDELGNPATVTSADDPLHPASAKYNYNGATPPQVASIEDRGTGRKIYLYYSGSGSCTTPPGGLGYDVAPPPNMLCKVDFGEFEAGTATDLFYRNGMLSAVVDPGNEQTLLGYTGGLLTSVESPLAVDWQAAGPGRGSAPVTTDIAYTWIAGGTAVNNVRPAWNPVSGPPYPAGSIPMATSVTAPAPDGNTAARPKHNYVYVLTNSTEVHVDGLSGHQTVTYDTGGRTNVTQTATGQVSQLTWDQGRDLPLTTTDPAGRVTTTVYDWALRATDSYGPAPAFCFQSSGFPVTSPPPTCGSIPHTHTGFDGDPTTGNRLQGLQATGWTNKLQSGPPSARLTAPPNTASWTSAQAALNVAGPASSQYTGEVFLPTNATLNYTFSASVGNKVDDGIRVFVDGAPVIDRWNTTRQSVIDDTPTNYWRLGETSGLLAHNEVNGGPNQTATAGTNFGGTAGPGTVDTSTAWNSMNVGYLPMPSGMMSSASTPTLEMWFYAAAPGVLFGSQNVAPSGAPGSYTPTLYVGSDNKLRGEFWNGSVAPITSAGSVVDAHWHHVVLTATTTSYQSLFLDGDLVGSLSGAINQSWASSSQLGTGAEYSAWPSSSSTTWATCACAFADVAFYTHPLTSSQVATHTAAGKATLTGTGSRHFDPAPTTWSGSVPAAPASTPLKIRIDYRNPTSVPSFSITATPTTGSPIVLGGSNTDPRYGLPTQTVTEDSAGAAGGNKNVNVSYNGSGLDPQYGLATDSTVDPGGLNLDTKTAYEAPGSGGFLRPTASALPSASISTPAQSTTTSYYSATDAVLGNTCGATTDDGNPTTPHLRQAGLPKTVTSPTPASGTPVVTAFVYDGAGRVVGSQIVSDGATNWTCTTFDARGRAIQVAIPAVNGAPARTVTSNYAVGGDPLTTSISDSSGTITTVTDLLGRTVSYTDAKGVVTTSAYDQAGRDVSDVTTAPGGGTSTVAVAYLDDGRISQVKLDGNVVATPSYNSAGELTGVSYPTGAGNGGNGGALASITRDPQGRETANSWTLPSAHSLSDTVTMSQAGRVMTETGTVDASTVSAWSYAYDAAGRLTSASLAAASPRPAVSYTYGYASTGGCGADTAAGADSARVTQTTTAGGTPTTTTSCTDYASRLTSATGANALASVTYNGHGDATVMGAQTITYSADDRVTAVNNNAGGVNQTVTYTLDAQDRLIGRVAAGTGTGAENSTTVYGYTGSGDTADIQLSGSNQLAERYLSLPGGVLLTRRYLTSGGDVWSIPNIHGDIVATTDASGTLTGSGFLSDPFGGPIDPTTGSSNLAATPTTRTGGVTDGWEGEHQRGYEHTGGVNATLMGARLYLPGWSQFTASDPIWGGNRNPYTYPNDPINGSDLTGECCDFGMQAAFQAAMGPIDSAIGTVGRTIGSTSMAAAKKGYQVVSSVNYGVIIAGAINTEWGVSKTIVGVGTLAAAVTICRVNGALALGCAAAGTYLTVTGVQKFVRGVKQIFSDPRCKRDCAPSGQSRRFARGILPQQVQKLMRRFFGWP